MEHFLKGENIEKIKKLLLFFEKNKKIQEEFQNFKPIEANTIKDQKLNQLTLYEAKKDHEYYFWETRENFKTPFKKGQILHVENISPRKNIFEVVSNGSYYYFLRDDSLKIILKEKK